MPIRLADLTKEIRTVTKHFEGTEDTLTITYRPRAWTPSIHAALLEAIDRGRTPEALVINLSTLVVEWDLLDDDGKPIPTTPESLRGVSLQVLNIAVETINADMLPDPTPAATSNGSSPTGSLS
jgi:hypothetical protein